MAKSIFLGATALRSVAILGLTVAGIAPAYAQDVPAEEPEAPTTAQTTQETEVVVTGSRIRGLTPFNSPDPISQIDPELVAKEGKTDIASMLQSSPIAAGSTQITSAISSNFVTNGGPGAQTIDLRGLGANRTLVLLNGRRAGPAGTRGGVSSFDLNVLPASLAAGIDILKTGASSVYGSDAVAGVVNITTKTDIEGLQIAGNVSTPFDGGGENYRLNAIYGKKWDTGHFLIGADYWHQNELTRGDRDYLACPEAYTFRPDGSRADLIDPRTGNYACEDLRWGHIWTYNLIDNLQLDGPGGPNTGRNTSFRNATVLLQYQYPGQSLGIPTYGAPAYPGDFTAPAGWFPTGYDTASLAVQNAYHPFVEQSTIIPKSDLYTVFAEGSQELTDSIELFGEFLFNRRETYQNGWRQFWSFGYTGDLYGYNPGGNLYNYWAGGFGGVNLISPTAITDQSDSSQKVDYYRGVAGLRGAFGASDNWKWEIYGQYSRSIGRYRNQQILQDAYDISTQQGFGAIGSCVGMVTPVSGRQCIDIPWTNPFFLRGELTDAQKAYLFDWEEGRTLYTQWTGEGAITGELFKVPGGMVGVALGAAFRRDEINDTPGEITRAGNAWGASTSGITAGSTKTWEAFGEVNVPLFKDLPFIHELSLSAAGRVTNVTSTRTSDGFSDSDNGNWTYKVGGNWAPTEWLRFRSSYGTSYRSPALFEQFLANETSFANSRDIDPCAGYTNAFLAGRINQRQRDNCVAQGIPTTYNGSGVTATVSSQGGIGNLEAETSKALVVGGVLTPKFGFLGSRTRINIAVDYFDIKVSGQVAQLGAASIIFGCYDSASFPTDPLCSLFTRGQTGAPYNINTVSDQYINIASQQNSGVDLTANVRSDLGSWGNISFTADMTWQTRDNFQLLPTSPVQTDNGEAGSPKWVGDFRLTWNLPNSGTTFFYSMNVIGGTSNVAEFLADNGGNPCVNGDRGDGVPVRGTYCPVLTTDATFYHSASITQEVADKFEITLGVSNLFNTRPPRVSVLNGGQISMLGPVVAASQYSFVGRRAFINVSAKF